LDHCQLDSPVIAISAENRAGFVESEKGVLPDDEGE
jgi:hypothetical protein